MSRYIDIDNIEVDKYVTVWDCNCSEYGRQTVMAVDDLHYLPTVDAQPVVHGKWIDLDLCVKCSFCGHFEHNPYFFCPNCGADMRGEEND